MFHFTNKLHHHITVVLTFCTINKIGLFHVRLFGLGHMIVCQNNNSQLCNKTIISNDKLHFNIPWSSYRHFSSVWLFSYLHCTASALLPSEQVLNRYQHKCLVSPTIWVLQVPSAKPHPVQGNRSFWSQVAWIHFKPADGIRNIHRFSGDKMTPPVVFL